MGLSLEGVGDNFGSSSLVQHSKKMGRHKGGVVMVPVLSMQRVMDFITENNRKVGYIKTDMQGFDLKALESVGSRLTKVEWMKNEVWLFNSQSYGLDNPVKNDLCRDWMSHMKNIGFELLFVWPSTSGKRTMATLKSKPRTVDELCPDDLKQFPEREDNLAEADAFWRVISGRSSAKKPNIRNDEWPDKAHSGGAIVNRGDR